MEAEQESGKESGMTFLDHLEELRWHIIKAVIAVLICAIAAFCFHTFIFDHILLAPKTASFISNQLLCHLSTLVNTSSLCINQKPLNIININMSGQFSMHISASIIAGFILAFPFVLYQVWKFIKPALHSTEQQYTKSFVFFTTLLFLTGVLFGYYVICPLSIDFLSTYTVSEQINNQITIESYISTITSITLASGLIFELPMLIYVLSKLGILKPEFLKKYRRHAIIIILIVAAIITPPDIFSQILVSIPLYLLFEIGIVISTRVKRNKEKLATS